MQAWSVSAGCLQDTFSSLLTSQHHSTQSIRINLDFQSAKANFPLSLRIFLHVAVCLRVLFSYLWTSQTQIPLFASVARRFAKILQILARMRPWKTLGPLCDRIGLLPHHTIYTTIEIWRYSPIKHRLANLKLGLSNLFLNSRVPQDNQRIVYHPCETFHPFGSRHPVLAPY